MLVVSSGRCISRWRWTRLGGCILATLRASCTHSISEPPVPAWRATCTYDRQACSGESPRLVRGQGFVRQRDRICARTFQYYPLSLTSPLEASAYTFLHFFTARLLEKCRAMPTPFADVYAGVGLNGSRVEKGFLFCRL